jgi:hypothetical protein
MDAMTREAESSAAKPSLLVAFELGERAWKLGFSSGMGQRPRVRQIPAGAVGVIANEIARAKSRFGLAAEAPVISCYEAGRDAFWLHRYLVAHDVTNHVVDSSSIEVNRRARRRRPTGSISVASSVCWRGMSKVTGGCGGWYACRHWLRRTCGRCRARWRP